MLGHLTFHDYLQIAQVAGTFLLVPLTKALRGIREEISDFKLYAARNYVTKEELKEHKCAT